MLGYAGIDEEMLTERQSREDERDQDRIAKLLVTRRRLSSSVPMMRAVTEEEMTGELSSEVKKERSGRPASGSSLSPQYRRSEPLPGLGIDQPVAHSPYRRPMKESGGEETRGALSPRSERKKARPLSSDHKRLATLLRTSTSEGGRTGGPGGSGIDGLVRRDEME